MGSLSKFSGASGPLASLPGTPALVNYGYTAAAYAGAGILLSGAMTANVWKTALSVTGRGRALWAIVYKTTDSARTADMRITIDGVVVQTASYTATVYGFNPQVGVLGLGGVISIGTGNTAPVFEPVDYRQSLLIEIRSSLTETDALRMACKYEVWA